MLNTKFFVGAFLVAVMAFSLTFAISGDDSQTAQISDAEAALLVGGLDCKKFERLDSCPANGECPAGGAGWVGKHKKCDHKVDAANVRGCGGGTHDTCVAYWVNEPKKCKDVVVDPF